AARAYGERVIGVVLTGMLDDGTAGLLAIKQHGGIAVVQDPNEAMYSDMPRNAMANVEVDYCVPLSNIAELLVDLSQATGQVEEEPAMQEELHPAASSADVPAVNWDNAEEDEGKPSPFACPDCNGILWEIQDGPLVRYRCRIGHAFFAGYVPGITDRARGTSLLDNLAYSGRDRGVDVAAGRPGPASTISWSG
ncbi:MAG: hypothetical protein HC893_13980, partial [Chloroflexaceae bacterium]|nr:hypothetical protein [Chloroflexaceae bacterium]